MTDWPVTKRTLIPGVGYERVRRKVQVPPKRECRLDHPKLIHRACGGWLAVSPDGACLRIGVTAETEDGARKRYQQTVARWMETLFKPLPQPPEEMR